MKLAWNPIQKTFSNYEKANEWVLQQSPATIEEEAKHRLPEGIFSKIWYAVYSTDLSFQHIVSIPHEAMMLVEGRMDRQQHKFNSYEAAEVYLKNLHN